MHVRTSFVGASPSFSTISAMIVALDGGPRPRTYERVAYIGVRNLPRGSLENLAAIMETTVQDAPALKFLDGVVAQGAKLRRPVHHYCLSWAPDEDPGPTEILQAVSESLVAQGLEDHQCVFFVHTNTHCIHVHLVVNRVHSDTGLAADVSRAGKILSPWARSWEERHGGVRCRRRPTPEETRAWEGLLNDQRRIDLDPEVQRLEREALARYVDECRAERGEPAAARPGRFVPRCWPRRELVLAQEEKELWAELFERHRLEDTPRHVCLQERRELAQRISEGRRVMQQAVRERAAAVDIDIDVLVDAKDAPQDAGGPRTMERWSYVQETVIPAAEGNLREIVRARLRDFPPFSVDELTAEPSSWNSQTEADSSARYRYWDNRLDFERGGRLCINADIWGDDAISWHTARWHGADADSPESRRRGGSEHRCVRAGGAGRIADGSGAIRQIPAGAATPRRGSGYVAAMDIYREACDPALESGKSRLECRAAAAAARLGAQTPRRGPGNGSRHPRQWLGRAGVDVSPWSGREGRARRRPHAAGRASTNRGVGRNRHGTARPACCSDTLSTDRPRAGPREREPCRIGPEFPQPSHRRLQAT